MLRARYDELRGPSAPVLHASGSCAIANQRDRRHVTAANLLWCLEALDKRK